MRRDYFDLFEQTPKYTDRARRAEIFHTDKEAIPIIFINWTRPTEFIITTIDSVRALDEQAADAFDEG